MAVSASSPSGCQRIEDVQALKDQVVGRASGASHPGDDQPVRRSERRSPVDPRRRRACQDREPYGTTIAHGNLTLSLIDGLRGELNEWSGFTLAVNYGWNKVRFPAPVVVGARLRCYQQIVEVTEVVAAAPGGDRFTVETEGGEKPVCVADSVVRIFRATASRARRRSRRADSLSTSDEGRSADAFLDGGFPRSAFLRPALCGVRSAFARNFREHGSSVRRWRSRWRAHGCRSLGRVGGPSEDPALVARHARQRVLRGQAMRRCAC